MSISVITWLQRVLSAVLLFAASNSSAAKNGFTFSFIAGAGTSSTMSWMRESLVSTETENLAFVLVNGVKPPAAPCSDTTYEESKKVFTSAKHGIVVSLAGKDWADCRGTDTTLGATGRLSRLRELLFSDEFSLGTSRLPQLRQSAAPKFRNYSENARWEVDGVMFATINLPANNNHYRLEAGRNSEFEDRLVATRDWLHHLAVHASTSRVEAIVLFTDGNPLATPRRGLKRDGFREVRKQISEWAEKFPGRILLVHGQPTEIAPGQGIRWQEVIGELSVPHGRVNVKYHPGKPRPFSVATANGATQPASR